MSLGDEPREMQPLVREFFQRVQSELRKKGMGDKELLEGIRPMLEVKGKYYGRGAPNQWRRPNSNPPAQVVFAAARLTGISLDELVFGDVRASQVEERQRQTEARLEQFEERLEQVLGLLEARQLGSQPESTLRPGHLGRPPVE